MRYELGQLWIELGDLRRAERYFQSLHYHRWYATPSDYYPGHVYEGLGDINKAKLHYGRFVRRWEDCDLALRPGGSAAKKRWFG